MNEDDFYYVYIIKNIHTNKVVYVGTTNQFKRRKWEHFTPKSRLSKRLGEMKGNFIMTDIGRFTNKEDALYFENEMIEKYDTINNGVNMVKSGGIKRINELKEVIEVKRNKRKEYKESEEYKIELKKRRYESQKKWNAKNKDKIKVIQERFLENHPTYFIDYYSKKNTTNHITSIENLSTQC